MPTKLYQFEKTDAGVTQKSPRHPIQALVEISKKINQPSFAPARQGSAGGKATAGKPINPPSPLPAKARQAGRLRRVNQSTNKPVNQ